jgi:hypothetical protein
MMSSLLPAQLKRIERQLRMIAILDGAERLGFLPLPISSIHTIAYFADALAPVWNLPIIDGYILKRARPYYPALQLDLDRLVGKGIVSAQDISYSEVARESWQLGARYHLNRNLAAPILLLAEEFQEQAQELAFVREVIYAISGFGLDGIDDASSLDAMYGDPLVDLGSIIDVDRQAEPNPTARVALRFGTLLTSDLRLPMAEMINLYARQLYSRIRVA